MPTINQIMEMSFYIGTTRHLGSIVWKLEVTKLAAASPHSAHHVYSAPKDPSSRHPSQPQSAAAAADPRPKQPHPSASRPQAPPPDPLHSSPPGSPAQAKAGLPGPGPEPPRLGAQAGSAWRPSGRRPRRPAAASAAGGGPRRAAPGWRAGPRACAAATGATGAGP